MYRRYIIAEQEHSLDQLKKRKRKLNGDSGESY
jgi:hypothetical protein